MQQPEGHHLAELNVGRLLTAPDDPLVDEFMRNIDRINGLGKRMPGFVWMMESEGAEGNTGTKIDGDERYVPNLTVWEDVASLETFVWGTVHKQFYERRREWFEKLEMHFVMWWVPVGHNPTLEDALKRLDARREHGDSENAFGWDYLKQAKLHKTHSCKEDA